MSIIKISLTRQICLKCRFSKDFLFVLETIIGGNIMGPANATVNSIYEVNNAVDTYFQDLVVNCTNSK